MSANRACARISQAVSRQRSREVIVDPPLVVARVRIQANGHECAAGAQHARAFSKDGQVIWEVVKCVDTENPLESLGGPGESLGASANQGGVRHGVASAQGHGPSAVEAGDEGAVSE